MAVEPLTASPRSQVTPQAPRKRRRKMWLKQKSAARTCAGGWERALERFPQLSSAAGIC